MNRRAIIPLFLILGLVSELIRGGTVKLGTTQGARILGALATAVVLWPDVWAVAAVLVALIVGWIGIRHAHGQHAGRDVPPPAKGWKGDWATWWARGERPDRLEAAAINGCVGMWRGLAVDAALLLTGHGWGLMVAWALWRPLAYELGWLVIDRWPRLQRLAPHPCEWVYGPIAVLLLWAIART